MESSEPTSIFALKRRVFELIQHGSFGKDVAAALLPNGQPHLFEKSLWDYKQKLPVVLAGATKDQIELLNIEMAEIIKDVVAFYNSYGGYLVAGVSDNPRKVVGFDGQFDCGDLAKRVKGFTTQEVDCHYSIVDLECDGEPFKIGILQIPQRPENIQALQFRKDAPFSKTGRQAFRREDIYLRDGDQSRPASSTDDYSILCSKGRRVIAGSMTASSWTEALPHNLGPRDPSLVKFIGREETLSDLWKWLCDRYSPVKLLAGMGGLGKTTIVREFAEDIIRSSPIGLTKIVWLSAKKQFYAAILDKYVPASRVDFFDLPTLLKALLLELGSSEEHVEPMTTREDLLDAAIESLTLFPALVIVDDVDSLEPQDQSDVFQSLVQISNRSVGQGVYSTHVLFTARLDLGAAPMQLVRLGGLSIAEFEEFVAVNCKKLGLNLPLNRRQVENFHRVSGGSPSFTSSILRLLQTGTSLQSALTRWEGSDGEAVRNFAFQRELDNLTDSQIRTLYALCILGETSQVELQHVTQSANSRLDDDLGELRKYHMMALSAAGAAGGARLEVPSTIRLMKDAIRVRVLDPSKIEQECARARSQSPKLNIDVGPMVNRAAALWRDGKMGEALDYVRWAEGRNATNPDIACLLGSAYIKMPTPDAGKADASFRKAHKLGCRRPELFNYWYKAKEILGDVVGIIEVTHLADEIEVSAENVLVRAQSYLELGFRAEEAGNLSKALEYYKEGGNDVAQAFRQGNAKYRVQELKELKSALLTKYVMLVAASAANANDQIEVWLASYEAFSGYVRRPLVVRTGVRALQSWWNAVASREKVNRRAVELMRIQLGRLDEIIQQLSQASTLDLALLAELDGIKDLLLTSWREYQNATDR